MSEKRSLIPRKIKNAGCEKYDFPTIFFFIYFFFAASGVARVNVETADCHVSAGMTGDIQMAS